MRIKCIKELTEEYLQPHLLNSSHTVVIDGHTLHYQLYRMLNVPFLSGPESNIYASYVKNYLETFKRSNVRCVFLIKGSHENFERKHWQPNISSNKPRLLKDIFCQVLNEMNFEYAITYDNDIVQECVALASKLSCPVISYNKQYYFNSVPYIPLEEGTSFDFDENNNMKCRIFSRSNFITGQKITEKKLIIFIILTDIHIFHEGTFERFFGAAKIGFPFKKRYQSLIQWLQLTSEDQALTEIFKYISKSHRQNFRKARRVLRNKILHTESDSMAILYFVDKSKVNIHNLDPKWLEKGVCLRYVDISYINLYHLTVVQDSATVVSDDTYCFVLLSLDVIKYAYDLLTNFNGTEIFVKKNGPNPIGDSTIQSIRKPNYTAETCVFENGWANIKTLRLFEHFLIETLETFNFEVLERLPADSRMLMIALVYFTRKKTVDVKSEIYSVIISYVMLAVVAEKADIINIENNTNVAEQPILDSTSDEVSVTEMDCKIAASIMQNYFLFRGCDANTVRPLVEFQRCLQELNNLNALCGSPFNPTVYAKTYSATFVYNVLCDIQKSNDGVQFITNILKPAASVLNYVTEFVEVFEIILYDN